MCATPIEYFAAAWKSEMKWCVFSMIWEKKELTIKWLKENPFISAMKRKNSLTRCISVHKILRRKHNTYIQTTEVNGFSFNHLMLSFLSNHKNTHHFTDFLILLKKFYCSLAFTLIIKYCNDKGKHICSLHTHLYEEAFYHSRFRWSVFMFIRISVKIATFFSLKCVNEATTTMIESVNLLCEQNDTAQRKYETKKYS